MHSFFSLALGVGLISAVLLTSITAAAENSVQSQFADNHSDDVGRDYARGVAALEAGNLAEAIEIFERIVLVYPNHAGAWLDLALVHLRLGQIETAAEILNHLRYGFSLPSAQQQQIEKLRQALLEPALLKGLSSPLMSLEKQALRPRWRYSLSGHLGYVRNANAGFSDLTFRLFPLGSNPLLVQLDSSQRARSDFSQIARLTAERLISAQPQFIDHFFFSAGKRFFSTERPFDQSDIGVGWARHLARGAWGAEFGATSRLLERGVDTQGAFTQLRLSGVRAAGRCRASTFLEPEFRDFFLGGTADSAIGWIGLAADCGVGLADHDARFQLQARSAVDRPKSARSGGVTDRAEVYAGLSGLLPGGGRLTVYGLIGEYNDREAYSTSFFGDQRRSVDRSVWALELRRELTRLEGSSIDVSIHYFKINDKSNLPIFRIEDEQLFFGLTVKTK